MEDLTLAQLWALIAGICGGVILITNAVSAAIKAIKAAQAPGKAQDERIEQCERDIADLKRSVDDGWKTIREQLQSTRLSQEALLALLDHGINGNNIKQMEAAKEKLRQHLLDH